MRPHGVEIVGVDQGLQQGLGRRESLHAGHVLGRERGLDDVHDRQVGQVRGDAERLTDQAEGRDIVRLLAYGAELADRAHVRFTPAVQNENGIPETGTSKLNWQGMTLKLGAFWNADSTVPPLMHWSTTMRIELSSDSQPSITRTSAPTAGGATV